ncbi:ABC transporter ATP-binding protein [Bacillus fonticola]|uniref:ABC transporter ATP-binding protein n=1 Tax=Bacillus fonticola TaxID=2728853 RepID=UPI00147312BC|nr:ABC transporter transmembrane domain-containing protein [Bacillus fonticola]
MFRVFSQLGWFFKEERKRYTIAISLLILVGIFDIVPPRLVGLAIDDMYLGTMTSDRLVMYIAILMGVTVTSYTLTYHWMYKLFGGGYLVERKLRSRLMAHLLRMSPPFYEKNRTGDLMARATNDVKAVSITAGFGVLTLIDASAFMLTVVVTMVILIDWKLTLAAMLPLPIMAYIIKLLGSKIHTRFMEAQSSFGQLNDRVLESVAGVRVLRAYVQERADETRFQEMTEDVYGKNMNVARIDALFDPVIKILVGMSYLIGLGYGSYLVFQQDITLGDLVTFNVYLGMMIWPMFAIGELINIMQRGNASLDRLNETFNYNPDVVDKKDAESAKKPDPNEFKAYSFTYPSNDQPGLHNLDFSLQKGQTLGVVGKTGSGKTTLVKQWLRYYPVGGGSWTIGGKDVADQPVDTVRAWTGYVPQDHILFSKSVRENIAYGKDEVSDEELDKAIQLAALDQDLPFLQDGLETLVGEKGVALSGGQKQRISIARAFVLDPDMLILDDSLSAVDAKTEARIIENIRSERKGKTTIITAHRLSAVQHADVILVLDDGHIVEKGTHDELMARGGWYATQYVHQQATSSYLQEVEKDEE